jgi:hypothetical protein
VIVGNHPTRRLMVPMPYFQKVLNSNGMVSPTEYLAGNPAFRADIGQISGTASIGNQSYNALQALMQKRLSVGLQYSVAYTYSKCMTNNLGYYGQGGRSGQSNYYYQNIYNAAAEWGRAITTRPIISWRMRLTTCRWAEGACWEGT